MPVGDLLTSYFATGMSTGIAERRNMPETCHEHATATMPVTCQFGNMLACYLFASYNIICWHVKFSKYELHPLTYRSNKELPHPLACSQTYIRLYSYISIYFSSYLTSYQSFIQSPSNICNLLTNMKHLIVFAGIMTFLLSINVSCAYFNVSDQTMVCNNLLAHDAVKFSLKTLQKEKLYFQKFLTNFSIFVQIGIGM